MKKIVWMSIILTLCFMISGCSSGDNNENDNGDESNQNEELDTDTSQESDMPLTFYETFEAGDETGEIASLIVSEASAPFTLEDFDDIGGPFKSFYSVYTENSVGNLYLTGETGETSSLSEVLTEDNYVKSGDSSIFFNNTGIDENAVSCGISKMVIDDDNDLESQESLLSAFERGNWTLTLKCSALTGIDYGSELQDFVDTYGAPSALYPYWDIDVDDDGRLVVDDTSLSITYMMAYEYEEYTIAFYVFEMIFEGRDDSNVVVDAVTYYTDYSWQTAKEYWGFE